MHRKIYFDNKILLLSTGSSHLKETALNNKDVMAQHSINDHIKEAIRRIQDPDSDDVVLINKDVEALYEAVKQEFTVIKAAGSLVYTADKKVLMIFRRGKWDLPKGKLDDGEDLETCAVRELKEETGVSGVQVQQPLTVTYHTYYEKGKHILKESHWFLMFTQKKQSFTPQTDEDIEKCEWVKLDEIGKYLQNSLPSIIDVIDAVKEILKSKKSI